jgi:hypothetical protein
MYFILNFDAKIRVAFAALANPHVVIGGENKPVSAVESIYKFIGTTCHTATATCL